MRGVSPRAHKRLKAKAASAGQSLSEYLREELEQLAEEASTEEILSEVASWGSVDLGETGAEAVRAEREERERQLFRAIDRNR